jgi:hypothetical protein
LSFGVVLWLRLGTGVSEIGGFLFMTATVPCRQCWRALDAAGPRLAVCRYEPDRAPLCCRNESYGNPVRARRAYTANRGRLELAERTTLRGQTPETPTAERERIFAKLAPYRYGAIFTGRFACEGTWERHPNGDEIVRIVDSITKLHIMTADAPQCFALSAAMVAIAPQGKWHRLEVQDEASVITRTHLNRPSISPSLSMIREPLE